MKQLRTVLKWTWPFAVVALCAWGAMFGANNRGNQGTAITDFIDRGMMDVLYHRQDGFSSSDITLFGDPNAASAARGWRVHYSKTVYYDLDVDTNTATHNMVVSGGSIKFQLNSSDVFQFAQVRDYDAVSATNGSAFIEDSHMSDILRRVAAGDGASVKFHFATPGQPASSFGPITQVSKSTGNQLMEWSFHPATTTQTLGAVDIDHFFNWTGTGDKSWNHSIGMVARNDPNTTNVRWKTIASLDDSSNASVETKINRMWEVNQTKASTDVVEFQTAGTGQWRVDSGGNLVDQAGNYVEFTEITAPGGGAANTARLYAVDNGAGKTQLVVVFNSGAAQVLATEP